MKLSFEILWICIRELRGMIISQEQVQQHLLVQKNTLQEKQFQTLTFTFQTVYSGNALYNISRRCDFPFFLVYKRFVMKKKKIAVTVDWTRGLKIFSLTLSQLSYDRLRYNNFEWISAVPPFGTIIYACNIWQFPLM